MLRNTPVNSVTTYQQQLINTQNALTQSDPLRKYRTLLENSELFSDHQQDEFYRMGNEKLQNLITRPSYNKETLSSFIEQIKAKENLLTQYIAFKRAVLGTNQYYYPDLAKSAQKSLDECKPLLKDILTEKEYWIESSHENKNRKEYIAKLTCCLEGAVATLRDPGQAGQLYAATSVLKERGSPFYYNHGKALASMLIMAGIAMFCYSLSLLVQLGPGASSAGKELTFLALYLSSPLVGFGGGLLWEASESTPALISQSCHGFFKLGDAAIRSTPSYAQPNPHYLPEEPGCNQNNSVYPDLDQLGQNWSQPSYRNY